MRDGNIILPAMYVILNFHICIYKSDSCMRYERIEEYIEELKAVYKCMNEKSLGTFERKVV